jgi:hypothetical protein
LTKCIYLCYNTSMKIITTKNSIIFLVMAMFLVSTTSAFAYVPGVWDPQPNRINPNEPGFYVVPNPIDQPVIMQTSAPLTSQAIATNLGINNTPTTTKSATNSTNTTTTKKTTATTTTAAVRNTSSNTELKPVVIDNGNNLAALSFRGSGGFMPSSVWQWFLVILFILAIIILIRILSRPAHHEVHGVTAH